MLSERCDHYGVTVPNLIYMVSSLEFSPTAFP